MAKQKAPKPGSVKRATIASGGGGKKNSGHAPKFGGLARNKISCPNQRCEKRQDPACNPSADRSIACGPNGLTKCPQCGTAISKGGWTTWKVA